MKLNRDSLRLYAITDRMWLGNNTLSQQVEECIKGGATIIQLREKNISFDEYVSIGTEIKKVADKYHIPFIINDDADVAIACNADGIHVGQQDMEAGNVRKKTGTDKILGVSVQTVDQAILAEKNGADYLGVGAVFSTSTKLDADTVSYDTLKSICNAVSIPVVAIGGISKDNISKLKGSGIAGISVISAIFAQEDIFEAAKQLKILSNKTFR